MPDVDTDVLARNRNYFEKLGDSNRPGGRWVNDTQAKAIWSHEADQLSGFREKLGSGPDFALPLFGIGPIGQANLAPAGTNGIRLGGGVLPFDRYPTVPSTRWQDLNRMKTPWIPNPAYKGEGFDTRWGSYGGYWGFPGRLPIEGGPAWWDVVWSIREPGIGRITPGDIYTVHHPVSDYDDRSTFVPDERNKWDVSSPLAKKTIPGGGYELGQELFNRAALWSAILMESFSQSLPPVISRFTLNPRNVSGQPFSINQNSREGFDQRVLPWVAGTLGGQLTIRLDMNRWDDYFFEIYAIPRSQFANPVDWKRGIFFWSSSTRAHTLWPSDLAVTEDSEAGGGLPSNYPTRNEDYAYSKIKGYPLVLSRGFRSVRENNFLNSDASQILPWPISIPASTLSFQTVADTANPDRYPYYKETLLDWTGEVRDPIQVLDQDGNQGGPAPPNEVLPVLDIQGKKLLPSGAYLLFLVAYRRDQRFAFARNQYKFLTPSKEVLEYLEWWAARQPWTNEFVDSAIANHHARSDGSRPISMIPDELCPIRVDTKRPTAVVQ
jgi:hypothetical protein